MGLAVLVCTGVVSLCPSSGFRSDVSDVSGVAIPNVPVVGKLKGKPFHVNEVLIGADGLSTVRAAGYGEDSARPFKLRFIERDGWMRKAEVEVRIQMDAGAKLEGQLIVWKPYADGTAEERQQQYRGKAGARLPRGITKVYVSTFPASGGESVQERFGDRISARIEFGVLKNGKLPGRIILALPDTPRSYILGVFEAEYRVRD